MGLIDWLRDRNAERENDRRNAKANIIYCYSCRTPDDCRTSEEGMDYAPTGCKKIIIPLGKESAKEYLCKGGCGEYLCSYCIMRGLLAEKGFCETCRYEIRENRRFDRACRERERAAAAEIERRAQESARIVERALEIIGEKALVEGFDDVGLPSEEHWRAEKSDDGTTWDIIKALPPVYDMPDDNYAGHAYTEEDAKLMASAPELSRENDKLKKLLASSGVQK